VTNNIVSNFNNKINNKGGKRGKNKEEI